MAWSTPALLGSFLASMVGCEVLRRFALRRALLDAPNARSLHTVPTPRLGGVAIVASTVAASLYAWSTSPSDVHALLVACTGVALLGLLDDLRPVPALARLVVQLGASAAFVLSVGAPPLLVARGVALPIPTPVVAGLLVVWLVGVLNIYNFMDGMDGLAGAQASAASLALAWLLEPSLAGFALALGAASAGFLAHNLPPARIFMGDAGSTFIGMAVAGLALIGMRNGVPITESALPLAPFLLDGTFTLLRRALRGERIWEAHRSHLYQRAVGTGLGHREVLVVYVGWIAVAAVGAGLASAGVPALVGAWGAALAGLLLVWRWVIRREALA